MPKASRKKYYAVKIGKEGPRIYDTWEECKENVARYPGGVHKSFASRTAAERWLHGHSVASAGTSAKTAMYHPGHAYDDASSSTDSVIEIDDDDEPVEIKPHQQMPVEQEVAPPAGGLLKQEVALPPAAVPVQYHPTSDIVLSDEQQGILQRVQGGRNVFFTGSAGTGKSVLLREIIKMFRGSYPGRLAITASTGIASVNIGGTTLHSWAGIGLGQETAKKLAGKIIGQRGTSLRRWTTVKILIIDEISMIDGLLFDKLDYIARATRRSEAAFGGIQLVLSGDFCQLPPVPDTRDGKKVPAVFAFDSTAWPHCIDEPVTLTRVFRQKEQDFVDMLNMMRFGRLGAKTTERFMQLSRPLTYEDDIGPTELYPTRKEVENSNNSRLAQIRDKPHTYNAYDTQGRGTDGNLTPIEKMQRLLERLVCPKQITLKTGAQVMLIKNLEQGVLVNGSTGKVIGFSTFAQAAQDHTAVANPVSDDREAKEIPEAFRQSGVEWPVVRFTNGREMLCIPQEFTVNNGEGETEAARSQIPLILAWALSVHKSQGQTLERVKVNLSRTFEKGQAYVALSRATSMDSLEVLNFDPAKVMAHPRVLEWHNELQQINEDDDVDVDFDADMDDAAFYFDQ